MSDRVVCADRGIMITQSHKSRLTKMCLIPSVALGLIACGMEDGRDSEESELAEFDVEDVEDLEFVEPEPGEEYIGVSERPITDLQANNDPVGFGFLGWFSEETPGASECPAGQVVTGFDCDGPYCDNLRLECHNYPGANVAGAGPWSAWFEHNGKPGHICPSGTKITGMDCWGSYCDNITIECTSAPGLDNARCAWSAWYSEENPSPFFADVGDAIQGVWCSGTHCDNKSFLVCET